MSPTDPRPVLLRCGALPVSALTEADLPELQRFFDANPLYFETVNGAPPRPDEAAIEFHDRPPAPMRYDRVFMLGVRDMNPPGSGELLAICTVIENLFAPDVWHIALCIVATRLHGNGLAATLHQAIQDWAEAQGARWMRLGVVCGNAPAERFWQKMGYIEVRQRDGGIVRGEQQRLSVRVKPLGADGIDAYLERVARDRPDPAAGPATNET